MRTMQCQAVLIFLLPLWSVLASSPRKSKPTNIFGLRARNYSILEAGYREMLKAQETKSTLKFLVVVSNAFPFDHELRQLCSFAQLDVRDFVCIDYSRLKKRIKQSCKVMLPPVVRLMQNSVKALEASRVVLSGKRREAVESNKETGLVIENMKLFPNVFDPLAWIKATLCLIKGLEGVAQDALETVIQVEELLRLIEAYKALLDMTVDELTDFSKCVSCVVKTKKKTSSAIRYLMKEKEKQDGYLKDLYQIRDNMPQPKISEKTVRKY